MASKYCLLLICLFSCLGYAVAQQLAGGAVYDLRTKEPIPFATIKFDENGHGVIANLEGKFEIPPEFAGKIDTMEVSSLGYQPEKISFSPGMKIYLGRQGAALNEVVITPPYDKIRRILNTAIARKHLNDPDKYDWYQCHMYYKMNADMLFPDSVMNDTTARTLKKRNFTTNQHMLMTETYSIRTWRRPQHLQEDVLATRFSGLKRSMFTSLITDVLPFHAYNNYLTLNGKDYHNPVSQGYDHYYTFNLTDEVVQGKDTTWLLSFRPRGNNSNNMKGMVYIHSDGFAISRFVARANDTVLKLTFRLEQQYEHEPVNDTVKRWFPRQLNYIIEWQQEIKNKASVILRMKGNSVIDSLSWTEDKDFRFDKSHTIRLSATTDQQNDSLLNEFRPATLNRKEAATYRIMDSIGNDIHLDKYMTAFSKLPEGKLQVGIADIDLTRLFRYNQYEHIRLGAGVQTNEHLLKWLSVGGWAGYGFGDTHWKYGLFAEVYADRYREFVFTAGYSDDLTDPGRIHISADLDKAYLNSYLVQRADRIKQYAASVRKKAGYLSIGLGGQHQQIMPQYKYALSVAGANVTQFTAVEASLGLRYAYAERTAPYYNYYYSTGSKYPIVYGKLTAGNLIGGNTTLPYTQALAAVVWHKHINRLGNEHVLAEAGRSWSTNPLPLSKLFAGNGYKYDAKGIESIYTFGGMMTMYPYEYYTDKFVNIFFRHDLDWKLFKVEVPGSKLSLAPNLCLQYNMFSGALAHPEAQQSVAFSVPYNTYHEAGILVNNLIRIRYANLFYLTLNSGYFYHINSLPPTYVKQNGRFVFGVGVEY